MKYFSHKVKYKDIVFDSRKERDRYIELRRLLQMGKIKELELQKEFELIPKQSKLIEKKLKTKTKLVEVIDERAVKYHCDFFYYDCVENIYIIEEIKSKITAQVRDYPLRRKLIKLMVSKMNAAEQRETYQFREIIS